MKFSRIFPRWGNSDVEIQDVKNRNIFHKNDEADLRGSIDVRFLIYVVITLIFGAVMNYSASSVYAEQLYGERTYFLVRYVLFALVSGGVTWFFVRRATASFWYAFAKIIYAVAIAMLLLVLVIGTVGGGAQRWLKLGPVTIQPSEVAKLGVVLMLALFFSDKLFDIGQTAAYMLVNLIGLL